MDYLTPYELAHLKQELEEAAVLLMGMEVKVVLAAEEMAIVQVEALEL